MRYKIINKKKKAFTIAADIIGYILWAPAILYRKLTSKAIDSDEIREILVVRTAYVGDVAMTMPTLKPLKDLFPSAKITFLTCSGALGLFKGNPCVDAVVAYDPFWFYPGKGIGGYFDFIKKLRAKRYDLVIEARADIRDIALIAYASGARFRVSYSVAGGGFLLTHVVPFKRVKHKVEYHLDIIRHLGGVVGDVDWGIKPTKDELLTAEEALFNGPGGNALTVAIHAGGRKGLKCWPVGKYAALADALITERGARIFFTGSPAEKPLVEEILKKMSGKGINLAGHTDMRGLIALISRADIFITNDSAPLHIASAVKCPTVAIFGPSKSNETGPYGNVHKVVEKEFPCRAACDEDVCLHSPQNECMDAIAVSDVLSALHAVIKKRVLKERAGHGV